MTCRRCAAAYATGRPDHFESDPRCAFPDGTFQPDNWNCALANALRDRTRQDEDDSQVVWAEDQNAVVLPWVSRFLVLCWYKHRGRTDYIGVLTSEGCRPITEDEAEAFLAGVPHDEIPRMFGSNIRQAISALRGEE